MAVKKQLSRFSLESFQVQSKKLEKIKDKDKDQDKDKDRTRDGSRPR